MWDYFFSNTPGYDVKTFSLTVPDVAQTGGGANLTLYLQGASVAEIAPNHNIEIRLNGTQIGGTISWNGDDPHVVHVDFPQALLSSGGNTLEITALAAPGLDYDVFYLDAVEISYDRLYRADGDRLEATATATGTITVMVSARMTSRSSISTHPPHPSCSRVPTVEAGEDGFEIRFSANAGTRFLATTSPAAHPAAELVADMASDLANPENTGRWVIVAGNGLEDEAEAFAAYRRAQGMSAVVARVEDIYDEFNGWRRQPVDDPRLPSPRSGRVAGATAIRLPRGRRLDRLQELRRARREPGSGAVCGHGRRARTVGQPARRLDR